MFLHLRAERALPSERGVQRHVKRNIWVRCPYESVVVCPLSAFRLVIGC